MSVLRFQGQSKRWAYTGTTLGGAFGTLVAVLNPIGWTWGLVLVGTFAFNAGLVGVIGDTWCRQQQIRKTKVPCGAATWWRDRVVRCYLTEHLGVCRGTTTGGDDIAFRRNRRGHVKVWPVRSKKKVKHTNE